MKLYGLMITKDDHPVLSDWCRDQLQLYDAVICLDGSASARSRKIASRFARRMIYLHERDFAIEHLTDHGLRKIVHEEICRRFGLDNWIMCCHADEFCYHDPRRVAEKAAAEGYDSVAWFSVHFLPHPNDLRSWHEIRHLPITERFRYYHWNYQGSELPWIEQRLYRNGPLVAWDGQTHGSVCPRNIEQPAPFRPILRHYKVITTDMSHYEKGLPSTFYRSHWTGLEHRTGLAYAVNSKDDLFVSSYPGYACCNRFDGRFSHAWNMGDQYCPDSLASIQGSRIMSASTRKGTRRQGKALRKERELLDPDELGKDYQEACRLAEHGEHERALNQFKQILNDATEVRRRALLYNDMGTMFVQLGDLAAGQCHFEEALRCDPGCSPAQNNLTYCAELASPKPVAAGATADRVFTRDTPCKKIKIAIVSFLFNWPSTGGGIFHTIELAHFLGQAGYEVQHFYPVYEPWGLGCVTEEVPFVSLGLHFEEPMWNIADIQRVFRQAIDAFLPDHVIITDSWNMKPHLAAAVRDYSYILRFQAMECLCPLNGVRLLSDDQGSFRQCHQHQLATPDACSQCIHLRGKQSGALHQLDRSLAQVGTPDYYATLVRALREATAVLVVNPLQEAMMGPYCSHIRVVTSGFDPARFPWPWPDEPKCTVGDKVVIFFAGLVEEPIKGFDILHAACAILWQQRRNFELVATGDPVGQIDDFTRFIGWQSQQELPHFLRAADVLVMPTIAQEALGRTAVEAMAVGRPVVASRLGGLPFTVCDGATGLLCEPGDPHDLAENLARLLDDEELRKRLGLAGRRRFETWYTWNAIIDRHYRPLLNDISASQVRVSTASRHDARTRPSDVQPMIAAPPESGTYVPFIPETIDANILRNDVASFFHIRRNEVEAKWSDYKLLHEANDYARWLGERKTLCFEEAFILYVIIQGLRPAVIVDIGTSQGKCTRRIIDATRFLGIDCRIVCVDPHATLEHGVANEAEACRANIAGSFREAILAYFKPDLLFVDLHTYPMLKEIVAECISSPLQPILAIHDCAHGLCNPRMQRDRNDPNLTSATGVWERHVLAELFGVSDPLSNRLDHMQTATHHLKVFPTPHGLAVILPRSRGFG